ncbi:hypothetical protein [Rhodanobacter sp. BL-MT-08]
MRERIQALDISEAKSPEMRVSLNALRRAAALARQTAIQTDTNLVVVNDGEVVLISADQLRRGAREEKAA